MWCLGVYLGVFTAVATIALPSSNGYVVFGCLPGVFTAVATIALPSSKGVCGDWVFTWVCLQQLL